MVISCGSTQQDQRQREPVMFRDHRTQQRRSKPHGRADPAWHGASGRAEAFHGRKILL
jgi:hypothetical protein